MDWVKRTVELLGLSDGGVIVLVDRAHDSHIGDLTRALVARHPDLTITATPAEITTLPERQVFIHLLEDDHLVPLNLMRPVFADRKWKCVLWARAAVAARIPSQAPDFFDWISHRVECPPERPWPWLLQRIQEAHAAGLGVIASRPTHHSRYVSIEEVVELNRVGHAVATLLGRPRLIDLELLRNYDALVTSLSTGNGWFWVEDADVDDAWRVRWAAAESNVSMHRFVWSDLGVVPPSVARPVDGRPIALRRLGRERRVDGARNDLAPKAHPHRELETDVDADRARILSYVMTGDLAGAAKQALELSEYDCAARWETRSGTGDGSLARILRFEDLLAFAELPSLDMLGAEPTTDVTRTAWHEARTFHVLLSGELGALVRSPAHALTGALACAVLGTPDWRNTPASMLDGSAQDDVFSEAANLAVRALRGRAAREPRAERGPEALRRSTLAFVFLDRGDGSRALEWSFQARSWLARYVSREHWLDGWMELVIGRARARLGQHEAAMDSLVHAGSIIRRTSRNPDHPFAILADLELAFLRATRGLTGPKALDEPLAKLEAALPGGHIDLVEARRLRSLV